MKHHVGYFDDRLARLGRFLLICGTAFAFFGVYYLVLGHHATAFVCGTEALLAFVLVAVDRRWSRSRVVLTNVFLAFACAGLVAISRFTGQAESAAPIFFCVAGLLAGHLMGVRAAMTWTVISTCCIGLAVAGISWLEIPQLQVHTHVDSVMYIFTVSILILSISVRAERSFEEYASRLFTLTERFQERTRLLSLAEEVAGVGHWRVDLDENKISFSEEACRICGFDVVANDPQELTVFYQRFSPEQALQLSTALDGVRTTPQSFTLELSFEFSGGIRYVIVRGISEQDANGNITAVFGIINDETDAKYTAMQLTEKAAALHTLATRDTLTGLANRQQFQTQLEDAIQNAKANSEESALLLMDMDGFKEINDTMGHPSGDAILREIAARLQFAVQNNDAVARLGGDEFTVILQSVGGPEDVRRRATKIADVVGQPHHLDGKQLALGVSIGAALCPSHGQFMDDLVAFADTAMYEAKSSCSQVAIYEPKMTEALIRRRQLECQLAQALDRHEFQLVYQPLFRIDGKSLIGFEALLRWRNDEYDCSPAEFIPMLENSQEILTVGQWVLREACAKAKTWLDQGFELTMSVNISPVQFGHDAFIGHVLQALDETGLDGSRLDLEVTEGVLIQEIESTTNKFVRLKEHGISISIDDFGTGYSSLAYLKQFPIDRLKIDREFVKDIPKTDDGTIASSMIALGHNLEMKVLAEGVETMDQLSFLKSADCDECQGFFLSRPMPDDECTEYLAKCQSDPKRSPRHGHLSKELPWPNVGNNSFEAHGTSLPGRPPLERY
jgi:diguanylate cyclase (GGDEF)-like protein